MVYSTAADTTTVQNAIGGLERRGELLLSGIGSAPLSLDVGPLVMRGLRVRGHVTGSPVDIQDAMQRLGVGSVPFFVAGDTAFSGAQPIDVFRNVLDDAIAAAK